MHLTSLVAALTTATLTSATITWTFGERSPNPTPQEADAYARIESAMNLAVARYNRVSNNQLTQNLYVTYNPSVPTADANINGAIRFGGSISERVALHEMGHTQGVGQTRAFDDHCAAGNWPTANPLVQSFDGPGTVIQCGGGHFWPYGLNYDNEFSEEAGDRHVQVVQAMVNDGMKAY